MTVALAGQSGQVPLWAPTTLSTSVWSGVAAAVTHVDLPSPSPVFNLSWPAAPTAVVEEEIALAIEQVTGSRRHHKSPNNETIVVTEPIPWWNPYPLANTIVGALRWPISYSSLARRADQDSPYALVKSIFAALKWPFPSFSRTVQLPKDKAARHGGNANPLDWSWRERRMRTIPQYVLDHAPLVHLFSGEKFWPSDMIDHLQHVRPYLNYEPLDNSGRRYNLNDLDELNDYRRSMYLTSDDNVEDRPEWLVSENGIPENPKSDTSKHPKGGRSNAPVIMIVIDKGHGIVDAFYFYFYSYNLGNKVLNVRFGNHVGDWEHNAIRFKHGKPTEVFFSQHVFGEAYEYAAVEKIGKRPVVYSATGTHAMYATPAIHRYILPWGLLHDETDRGPLWDPLLNAHSYVYNLTSHTLLSSTFTPKSPTEWFYFLGHWGDKAYPLEDKRQYYFAGEYHYVDGPLGPIFKNLGRKKICINEGGCELKRELSGAQRLRFFSNGQDLDEAQALQVMDEARIAGMTDERNI